MRKYSDEQLRKRLAKESAESTQRAIAKRYGVSPSLLCDTISGRRDPAPKLVKAMGLARIISYVEQ